MLDESLLKKLKIKDIESHHLYRLEELQPLISAEFINPEKTLYEIYKEVKKQKHKNKAEKKALEDAEKMILSIAGLAYERVEHHQPAGERRERRTRFREVDSLTETTLLRTKIVQQEPLSLAESLVQLQKGNRAFAGELRRRDVKPHELNEYDAILLTCSDARCDPTDFDTFVGKKILVLQLAGNPANEDVQTALRKLAFKGEVIVCGHTKCGACDAKHHEHDYRGKVSKHVDHLLDDMDIEKRAAFATDIYAANAINQGASLSGDESVRQKKGVVRALVFDFTDVLDPVKSLQAGPDTEFVSTLRRSGQKKLTRTLAEGKDLAKQGQYAHAIVVSDPKDLGNFSNARVLFNAGLNELFNAIANGSQLSPDAIASVEYALLKVNGVKDAPHIVIVHSDPKIAEEIKAALLSSSEIIREKTKGGALITVMQFDRETGDTRQFKAAA